MPRPYNDWFATSLLLPPLGDRSVIAVDDEILPLARTAWGATMLFRCARALYPALRGVVIAGGDVYALARAQRVEIAEIRWPSFRA